MKTLEAIDKNLDKILIKSAKNMYDLARSCQESKRKSDKSERKQTKTDANRGMISVPIIPQQFTLQSKLSRPEI